MGFVLAGWALFGTIGPHNWAEEPGPAVGSTRPAREHTLQTGLKFFSALLSLKARRTQWREKTSQTKLWWLPEGRCFGGEAMSMGTDSTWVGKKPLRRIGGMADALSIASDLGFSVAAPPTQEELQNLSSSTGEKGDDLIKVLRDLTSVQRKIADLQVELQGRKDDKNVAHLTHASEMEKKCETLARITTILKDVIQNKDRIIARLQQPYSLDCIPVEAEYQKQFSELLMKAASDYGALTASVADFQWSQTFKEPPSVWGEMLRPIPVALASCTRFFEAMSAMRESFSTLQHLRVGHTDVPSPITPGKQSSRRIPGDSECVTPPPWRTEPSFGDLAITSSRKAEVEHREAEDEDSEMDGTSHRRLSWPPSVKKNGV